MTYTHLSANNILRVLTSVSLEEWMSMNNILKQLTSISPYQYLWTNPQRVDISQSRRISVNKRWQSVQMDICEQALTVSPDGYLWTRVDISQSISISVNKSWHQSVQINICEQELTSVSPQGLMWTTSSSSSHQSTANVIPGQNTNRQISKCLIHYHEKCYRPLLTTVNNGIHL